jgi:hypothetical protein
MAGGRRRKALFFSLWVLILAARVPAWSSEPPVRAELFIPPAETYVIGDAVPLYWRFENVATQPLAFMWEGCCRLNGRLTVTLAGRPLTPLPPGQALAHMFAKAERLDPGKPRDFDTRLSDWVSVTATGTYELRGRYTGVLPDQQPQIPKGLALWRAAAHTPVITVDLISPADYWRQRADRERRRGLRLELSAARSLPPLQAAPLRLRVTNLGTAEQNLDWPDSLALWLVNADGQRVTSAGTAFEGNYARWVIPAGGSIERELPFAADRLEGEPFGTYRVFLDLATAGPTQPRIPSNAAEVDWDLSRAAVVDLLEQAAAGTRTGARNAPLRLLRVYVAELGPVFAAIQPAEIRTEALPLLTQLRLAACLKPVQPKPGRIDLALRVAEDGALGFADDRLTPCLAADDSSLTNRLARLLRVRRHLGWEVGLVMVPAENTPVGRILETGESLRRLQADLVGPVRLRPAPSTNLLAGAFCLTPSILKSDLDVVLAWESGRTRACLAQSPPAQPRADQLAGFQDCAAPEDLERVLAALPVASPRVHVLAHPEVRCAEVFRFGEPLLRRGLQVTLARLSP